jgi:hypothetical protein
MQGNRDHLGVYYKVNAQWLPYNEFKKQANSICSLFSMQFDSTGTFQVISVPPDGNYEPLERLRRCTLCYGKTRRVCSTENINAQKAFN